MRARGITYDTGFITTGRTGPSTREPFDPEVVRRELRVIRDDLHCAAVRVTGSDPDRLEVAARYAVEAGLEVWFSPFTCDLTTDELLNLLADCAERAERLAVHAQRTAANTRRSATHPDRLAESTARSAAHAAPPVGRGVVFVTGAELTLFTKGFLPGDTIDERLGLLTRPDVLRAALPAVPALLNDFLGRAVAVVRERFHGPVTYAALPTERVDWAPFDFVGSDAYRSIEVADRYADSIRALVAGGKPVAITEFGCTTHRGSADLGARGGFIVDWITPTTAALRDAYVRDESEQVTYLRELLGIFTEAGVDTAFWCTFSCPHLPHRDDPGEDLDLASYGVVKVLEGRTGETYPGMPWEPKAAFAAMADAYRQP